MDSHKQFFSKYGDLRIEGSESLPYWPHPTLEEFFQAIKDRLAEELAAPSQQGKK